MTTLFNHKKIQSLRVKCLNLLDVDTLEEALSPNLIKRNCNNLYSLIDGKPLAECKENPSGQLWLTGITRIVSGKNFSQLVKLRIGRLPTLENTNRGREAVKLCRKCGRVNETLRHVIQNCHSTHFERMQRHDSVACLIQTECNNNNYTVLWEPIFQLDNKKLKPDLVVITPDEIVVVDVSIVTEHMRFEHLPETQTLSGAWDFKANFYKDPLLTQQLITRFEKQTVWYGAIILSLRGLWCTKNDVTLRRLKIPISLKELCVVRSMEGSLRTWRRFMAGTNLS